MLWTYALLPFRLGRVGLWTERLRARAYLNFRVRDTIRIIRRHSLILRVMLSLK